MVEFVVIADAGGSKTVAQGVRLHDAAEFAAQDGPCVPSTDLRGALDCISRIAATLAAASGSGGACALALSSAGIDTHDVRAHFEAALRERFAQVRLVSDGEAALLGCFGDRAGAVVSVGTGVVAHARSADGTTAVLGGWGWPAGDRGGGAWLGRRAVEEFLDAVDAGRTGSDPLFRGLAAMLGDTREEVFSWLAGAGRRAYAEFAGLVVEAELAGSGRAAGLLAEAGKRVGTLVQVLNEAGHGEVAITGGLAATLCPFVAGTKLRVVPDACLAGARRLAAPWLAPSEAFAQ